MLYLVSCLFSSRSFSVQLYVLKPNQQENNNNNNKGRSYENTKKKKKEEKKKIIYFINQLTYLLNSFIYNLR